MAKKTDYSSPRRDDELRREIRELLRDKQWPKAASDTEVAAKLGGCSKAIIRMVREEMTHFDQLEGEARSDHPSRGYKPNAVVRKGFVHDGKGGVKPAGHASRRRKPAVKFARTAGVVRIDTEGTIEMPPPDYRDWLREQLAATESWIE